MTRQGQRRLRSGGATRQGGPRALPLRRASSGTHVSASLSAHLQALPWRLLILHATLFSFWVTVLIGVTHLVTTADHPVGTFRIQTSSHEWISGERKPGPEGAPLVESASLQASASGNWASRYAVTPAGAESRGGVAAEMLDPQTLQTQLSVFRSQSFYALDLAQVRRVVERSPWVASASVRRSWPRDIVISVALHEPAYLWNDDALLSRTGQLIRPEQVPELHLPRLRGPEGRHAEVYDRYRDWDRKLGTAGLSLIGLELDSRGAWTGQTDQDFDLHVGRHEADSRIALLAGAWSRIRGSRADRIERIDLRYTRGLAVRWQSVSQDQTERATVALSGNNT